jgi:hypothetical protein
MRRGFVTIVAGALVALGAMGPARAQVIRSYGYHYGHGPGPGPLIYERRVAPAPSPSAGVGAVPYVNPFTPPYHPYGAYAPYVAPRVTIAPPAPTAYWPWYRTWWGPVYPYGQLRW